MFASTPPRTRAARNEYRSSCLKLSHISLEFNAKWFDVDLILITNCGPILQVHKYVALRSPHLRKYITSTQCCSPSVPQVHVYTAMVAILFCTVTHEVSLAGHPLAGCFPEAPRRGPSLPVHRLPRGIRGGLSKSEEVRKVFVHVRYFTEKYQVTSLLTAIN